MTQKPASTRAAQSRRGFALIVTISLLVLVMIIAVGMLSLSAIALRSSSSQTLQQAARDNARLSLLMALGELQRLAGPDQRITAPAAILDATPENESLDGVPQPHLTGIWKSWKWEEGQSANYASRKDDDFLGWLVSDPADLYSPDDRSFVEQQLSGQTARLVAEGTAEDPQDHVEAALVGINDDTSILGSMAWAVFDEGAKAKVTLPDPTRDHLGDRLSEMAAPSVPGFGSVNDGLHDWQPLAALSDERLKLISHGQTRLAGLDKASGDFHHLTSHSLGLPTNVADGGFATDLSLLFERPALPREFSRRYLYSDGTRPLVNPPTRFGGAHVMPSPDPSWRLLHSHARLHESVNDPSGTPTIGTRVRERPPAGLPSARAMNHPSFHEQQLAPVIAKAQFVFSFGFAASPAQGRGNKQPGAGPNENWIIWLVTDPVITLWNPYDTSLRFDKGRVDLYRVPLAFQIYRNGRTFTSDPTLFANTYLPGEFRTRAERYYRLNLKPGLDDRGREESQIVMKPGEHLVFTAHNHVKHYREAYYNVGVDLRPGWNPPAGQASNENVGGISSLNLCVDYAGKNSARINGVQSRVIPVKAGDRITVAVSPAHADVDELSETGRKEVTAYLKYYMGSSDGTSTSLPPFVGAIELDYGDKENELLESYGPRDLPTLIVPRGLPPQQGDNYVGKKPPPAVRVKEPFLVASLHLKTEKDSRFPSRSWLHNSPSNLYASMGLDQNEEERFHQYEFTWEPMTDWNSSPTIEIDPLDRGFGASGLYTQTGTMNAPFASVPVAPLMSMAQLRHAPINFGGQLPLQTQAIANSFAHPLLRADRAREVQRGEKGGQRTFLDHSFYANNALFDRYFFSSASSQSAEVFGQARGQDAVLTDFFTGEKSLPNPRMRPFRRNPGTAASLKDDPDTAHSRIGTHLGIDGAFNVNSTSVAAWMAVLASLQPPGNPRIDLESGNLGNINASGNLASRHLPPTGDQFDGTTDPVQGTINTWGGHRRLDDYQIEELARKIVAQVKQRGPFQSLAEFVNRRLSDDELGLTGALQAAIDASGINLDATAGGTPLPADVGAAHPEAGMGTTSDGAPAVINQGDLLTPLAPILTARSDTFKIRAYGEATRGNKTARAWCEAVVQRSPEFLKTSTEADTPVADLEPDSVNERFGRRFALVSFRWLSPEEV